MKSLLFPLLAGALCLPATYRLSRDDHFVVAFLVIVVIGALAAAMAVATSGAKGPPGVVSLVLAFALGAFSGETIGFMGYYLDYGYKDQYLGVGVVFTVVEFLAISGVGGAATWVAALALRRARRRPAGSDG